MASDAKNGGYREEGGIRIVWKRILSQLIYKKISQHSFPN